MLVSSKTVFTLSPLCDFFFFFLTFSKFISLNQDTDKGLTLRLFGMSEISFSIVCRFPFLSLSLFPPPLLVICYWVVLPVEFSTAWILMSISPWWYLTYSSFSQISCE